MCQKVYENAPLVDKMQPFDNLTYILQKIAKMCKFREHDLYINISKISRNQKASTDLTEWPKTEQHSV